MLSLVICYTELATTLSPDRPYNFMESVVGRRRPELYSSAWLRYYLPMKKREQEPLHRCWWCGEDPIYVRYHDREWGVPVHNDRKIFEMLILEGFQAGLSWFTILKRRPTFRKAFCNFDVRKVAAFTQRDVRRLLQDPGIIRNRLKVEGAVKNARAFIAIQKEFGTFNRYLWSFTGGKILHSPKAPGRGSMRVTSPESDALSRDLKKRGFTFVGSTIMYAFMQAIGMVNDHTPQCFRQPQVGQPQRKKLTKRPQ